MSDPTGLSLAGAIAQVTIARGETANFSVRVPHDGDTPQYFYDDDPENPVEVPLDIIVEAQELMLLESME